VTDMNITRLNAKIATLEQRVLNARTIGAAKAFHRQLDAARKQRLAYYGPPLSSPAMSADPEPQP